MSGLDTSTPTALSVLLVDDEPLARLRLRQLVESEHGVPARVVGEAGDAATAEVFATAAMMLDGDQAMAMLEHNGLAGLAVGDDGCVHRTTTLRQFEA